MRDTVQKIAQKVVDGFLWAPSQAGLFDRDRLRGAVDYSALASSKELMGPQQAQEAIRHLIESDKPALISRFGSTELRMVLRHYGRQTRSLSEKAYALLTRFEAPVWVPWEHTAIRKKSGFYPVTQASTNQFAEVMLDASQHIDLLGSWVPGENQLREFFPKASITALSSLSPFGFDHPWTSVLTGRKVLVIHPFTETIRAQYRNREKLHDNPEILPQFELRTLKAVQSLGTPPADFKTWFDGLDSMVAVASKIDFDVALIGCGAYGFPLGARLKALGRKSIVLGGLVQLLFGVKGKRWDSSGLYNNHWIRPKESERPDGYFGADKGAYW